MYYSLNKYEKKGSCDIITDISENVTLVKLMDYLGNVNNAISVVGYWIFESNYEKSPVRNRESLNMICAPHVGAEQVADSEIVFTAVRYICLAVHLKKE